ncbi:unnamed protein product [Paramecium octaurelia]|uniref:Uncharacterized protein n=1 Tax=Paramecium octaurelia TaxID=43137 RepID=A0A8S1UCJ5_PAROT|nr:unnamed protein product [Paramecium octaurelia]
MMLAVRYIIELENFRLMIQKPTHNIALLIQIIIKLEMQFEQLLQSKIECQMKEMEKELDQSFDKINNLIDLVLIIDNPIKAITNLKSQSSLPKLNEFPFIHQSKFQSNILQEFPPLIKSQLQFKQHHNIQSQSSFNLKSFNWIELKIIIYEFKQEVFKQIQILDQLLGNLYTLNFMKKSNQLISGDHQGNISIQSINNNYLWVCSQTIKWHNSNIRCLIVNKNEDLFISGSGDNTIKFQVKQNEWICSQTITDHQSYVYSLSLNDQQNQFISCGYDKLILIIEYSEQNRNWIPIQKINVDCYGIRLCFINNTLFTFQPTWNNSMHVYEMNSLSKYFTKTKDIIVNQGNDDTIFFPQQYIKQKQLLLNKHDIYINIIRIKQTGQFKLEQSIQFGNYRIFGSLSDDGDYLITWDEISKEIQIRKYTEQ